MSEAKDLVKKLTSLCDSPKPLLQATANHLQKVFPHLSPRICDHICYRVTNMERYNDLKNSLQTFAVLKNESLVNGRPICIFQLKQPITFSGITTGCIELPAPKIKSSYTEGWEHAEIVIPTTLEEFMLKYPEISFDLGAFYKDINREITVTTPQGFRIKFHEQSILKVIELEQNL